MWRGADALPVSCQWFESSEQQHGKTTRGSCPTTLKSHHSLGATHAACQTILCCPRLMLWLARCFWIRLFSSACSYHPSVQGAGMNKKQPEPKTLSGSEAETVYRTVCSTDWRRENLCTDNVNLTFDKLKKKKNTTQQFIYSKEIQHRIFQHRKDKVYIHIQRGKQMFSTVKVFYSLPFLFLSHRLLTPSSVSIKAVKYFKRLNL